MRPYTFFIHDLKELIARWKPPRCTRSLRVRFAVLRFTARLCSRTNSSIDSWANDAFKSPGYRELHLGHFPFVPIYILIVNKIFVAVDRMRRLIVRSSISLSILFNLSAGLLRDGSRAFRRSLNYSTSSAGFGKYIERARIFFIIATQRCATGRCDASASRCTSGM